MQVRDHLHKRARGLGAADAFLRASSERHNRMEQDSLRLLGREQEAHEAESEEGTDREDRTDHEAWLSSLYSL